MAAGKRKAAKVSPLELWNIFNAKCDAKADGDDFSRYDLQEIDKIGDDIKKVRFDFENCEYGPCPEFGDTAVGLRGLYVQGGWLHFIGVSAGGDWEFPVYFIIYLDKDGKTLRAYIPKDGNAWNHDTKEALGNDEYADSTFIKKWMKKNAPEAYQTAMDGHDEKIDGPLCLDMDRWADVMRSDHGLKADISSRIEVV